MSEDPKDSSEENSSITLTDHSATGAVDVDVASLLGKESCPKASESKSLLRIAPTKLTADLRKRLGVNLDDQDLMKVGSQPMILGPLATDLLHSLAVVGAIGSRDQILLANDRWRALVDVYPDLKGLILDADEFTHTATETLTEAVQDSPTNAGGEDLDVLEIEGNSETPLLQSNVSSRKSRTHSLSEKKPSLKRRPSVSPQRSSALDGRWVLGGVALIVFIFFWGYPRIVSKKSIDDSSVAEVFRREMDEERLAKLPQNLKPLAASSLYVSDDSLMRKLRTYLKMYEGGSTYFSEDDLRVIRGIASPASSSFKARVSATNFLVSYYFSKANYKEARALIKPMLIAAPADVDTLINASILEFENGDMALARNYAISAQRLCRAPFCWVPYTILGLIEASRNKTRQSNVLFQNAVSSMQNTLVMGMWLNALSSVEKPSKSSMTKVLTRSLWVDPDRHIDTPLRAPLALHWIYSKSTEGYRQALSMVGSQMSPGKRSYVQWLMGRNPFVPAMESMETVAKELASEDDTQSQVLYAYSLSQIGNFDRASQVINRTLPLVNHEKMGSVWPWILAGNIHEEREVLDQAILSYQGALSRNSRDVNAIYGLAISLRDKEDYVGSVEKIAETLRLDPTFVPALLRLRRLEWHSRWLEER